ncbi:MAG TPA: Ig-like domain-containing protein [Jatrophihabitantaceae bacterium]|nr:Ig-like domain-containing protein [Jatrophihabitantaceae bacterium]
MTETASRARRFGAFAALVVALLVPFVAAVVVAAPAHAAPCETCGGGGGDQPVPWTSSITVTAPATGTIVAMSGTTRVIDCGAAGNDCSQSVTTMAFERPTSGWPTYTFSYSGLSGYIAEWSGACSGFGACSVTNDQESQSLAATAHDVQAPSVSIVAPTRVSPTTTMSATVADNSGSPVLDTWQLCNPDGIGCVQLASGYARTVVSLANQAAGDYQLKLIARDPSGNETLATHQVTLVTSLQMTSSDLAAVTEAPSVTFFSDDETHIASRRCRAYPTGDTVPDWGPCTTDTSYAPTLADGDWTLQVEDTDDVGLVASVSKQTTVDTTAPSVSFVDGPAEGGTVSTPTVQISFAASDATLQSVTCAVDDAAPAACTSPQGLSGYRDGTHKYTVTATDQLGHSTTIVRNFMVNVPTTLTAATVASTYGTAAPLSVTIDPQTATGTVKFVAAGKTLCTATVSNGIATCTAPATLAGGTRTVTASYHGNYAPSATTLKLVVHKATTAVHASAAKAVKRGKKLSVSVSHLPRNATGKVVISNATKLCTATVRHGAASCTFAAVMTKGSHTLSVHYLGDTNYAASTKTIKVTVV